VTRTAHPADQALLRQEICRVGRSLFERGLVHSTAGNISVRLPGGGIAITRSGGHKGFLDERGVIVVDAEGRPREAGDRASAETGLHCGIYRRFPEAGAVLHGHSVAKALPGLPTHEAEIAVPVV